MVKGFFRNKKRVKALNRRKNGTFGEWKGGRKKKDLKKKRNSFHGIATHIGLEFKRQHGKKAKVGDAVRTKTKDGSYHKGAEWYVKTPDGWRKARTGSRKPSSSQIKDIIKISREGQRPYRKNKKKKS